MSCKINPTLAFLLLDTEPALLNSVRICIYIYQKSTIFAYTNRALKFYLKGTLGLEALSPLSQGLKVAVCCHLLSRTSEGKKSQPHWFF